MEVAAANSIQNMKTKKQCSKINKVVRKRRVTDEEFEILGPGEEESLSQKNYNVKQLKQMCRHYKQKVSGNKNELKKRLYNYLRLSKSAIVLQRVAKNYILRKLLNAKGPAFLHRSKCVNDFDFFTMESVSDIWSNSS